MGGSISVIHFTTHDREVEKGRRVFLCGGFSTTGKSGMIPKNTWRKQLDDERIKKKEGVASADESGGDGGAGLG